MDGAWSFEAGGSAGRSCHCGWAGVAKRLAAAISLVSITQSRALPLEEVKSGSGGCA